MIAARSVRKIQPRSESWLFRSLAEEISELTVWGSESADLRCLRGHERSYS